MYHDQQYHSFIFMTLQIWVKQSVKVKLQSTWARACIIHMNLYQSICVQSLFAKYQVYDAINEDSKLPNIEYPDTDASKAIIEFHACKYQSYVELFILILRNYLSKFVLDAVWMSQEIETTNMHQFIWWFLFDLWSLRGWSYDLCHVFRIRNSLRSPSCGNVSSCCHWLISRQCCKDVFHANRQSGSQWPPVHYSPILTSAWTLVTATIPTMDTPRNFFFRSSWSYQRKEFPNRLTRNENFFNTLRME